MRVLVVGEPSMFGEGIEAILRQEPGLEVVGRETDWGQAASRVREIAPDVVVLTDGEAATSLGLGFLRLVREGFHVRVVEVHVETNTLCIYCGERQSIREVRDLVDTLGHICDSVARAAEIPLSPAMGEPDTRCQATGYQGAGNGCPLLRPGFSVGSEGILP
jgi:chemotaxis response regulator CheB